MLSDRRQRVLAALIEEYVSHALPVGSRTLVENYGLGVSSATVRNELSVLEEEGYITQPHTSAGRVPTDFGYRTFVDGLLEKELDADDNADATQAAIEEMKKSATELDTLIEQTAAALSRFTDSLSIVLPPSTLSLRLHQVSFVPLTPHRALIVVVTENGQVLNRSVEFGDPVSAGDLASVQELFNGVLAGKSFSEVRDSLDANVVEAFSGPLARLMLNELFACLNTGESSHARRLGLTALMQQPEFTNSSSLLPVLQVLEDETVLLQLLHESAAAPGTVVRIGSENNSEQLMGVFLVARQYGCGKGEGIVAVIGPTRMNYARAIRAVRAAQRALEDE